MSTPTPALAVAALFGGLAAVFIYKTVLTPPPPGKQPYQVVMHRRISRTNELERTDLEAPQEHLGGAHLTRIFGPGQVYFTSEVMNALRNE